MCYQHCFSHRFKTQHHNGAEAAVKLHPSQPQCNWKECLVRERKADMQHLKCRLSVFDVEPLANVISPLLLVMVTTNSSHLCPSNVPVFSSQLTLGNHCARSTSVYTQQ